MSTTNPLHQKRHSGTTVQHSKERALSVREFEQLLEGAKQLGQSCYYYDPDPELTIYVLGRLGLRRGELVHLREEWIDWRQKMIQIPAHDPCRMGEGGSVCGDCKQSAMQRVDHADDLTLEEALEWSWCPKTEAGARDVYFGHDCRAEMYLERYFESDEYDRFEASGTAISRRVAKAAENAREIEPEDVHPHSLRATAASHMAGRGLGTHQLMQYFGWVKIETAERYISRSSTNTANKLDGLNAR